ncbi:MAG: hypothetical protein HY528_03015 [Chloroflexi bacterium]|nr:hypothetical protein [Chloroflexota bacterium]
MAETLEQEARRLLADVPKEYMFKSSSGHSLCNLKELGDELTTMSDENYVFHARSETAFSFIPDVTMGLCPQKGKVA